MKNFIIRFVFFGAGYLFAFFEYRGNKQDSPEGPLTHRDSVRLNAKKFIEASNDRGWGTFVAAEDTLYANGQFFLFDTINLIYKSVIPADGKK